MHLRERIADPVQDGRQGQVRREARRAAGGGAAELVLDDGVHARTCSLTANGNCAGSPRAVRKTASGVLRLCAKNLSASR
jgi:hypothetical protein